MTLVYQCQVVVLSLCTCMNVCVHIVMINLEGVKCDHAHSAITFYGNTHTAFRISLCAFVQ